MWSRSRHLLLVACALAAMPLGWAAAGAGELAPGIVAFELAGTRAGAQRILDAWARAGALGAAARAVEWDFAFIAAYALGLGLLATALARGARAPWDKVGLAAAGLALAAGALDFAENLALLAQLDGVASGSGAGAAAACAAGKFALLAAAVLATVATAVARLARRAAPAPPLAWDISGGRDDLLPCDVVMKGGITSGIVYPGAVFELAKRYRFVNVGGSSAGAIAAAVTAAAEHRRRRGGGFAGFAALRDATASLAADDRLFAMFQPARATAPLFDVAAAALRPGGALARGGWIFFTALAAFPLASGAALLLPAALAVVASARLAPGAAALVFVACVLLAALLFPLALAAAASLEATRRLPREGYGLCPGPTVDARRGEGLSDWLADRVDAIAFGDERPGRPLTLGDLWCADLAAPSPEDVAARAADPTTRSVNFEVLTTCLTHGRPYRIPFDAIPLWFEPRELRRVLPARVVEFMVQRARLAPPGSRLPPPPDGALPLPPAADLPVVFLARLSLSFPFLLAAARLVSVRFGPRAAEGEERARYEDVWFSDGGIASNFPIHFFDQMVPRWPTFGLDLGAAAAGAPGAGRVRIAHKNAEGILEPWIPIGGVGAFAGALLGSLHAWLDNMQKRAPGYRDRIARIDLSPEEGGLNLRMPPERVARIAGYGARAGAELGARFDPRPSPSGEPVDAWAWDNHRWVRLRSALALLERSLRAFRTAIEAPPAPGARSYRDLLEEEGGPPPSYRFDTNEQKLVARELTEALESAPTGAGESLSAGAPRPMPELRIVPKV
jgi:predicted acylesterase/phospholipase RssA